MSENDLSENSAAGKRRREPSARYRRARQPAPIERAAALPAVYFVQDVASAWIKISFAEDLAKRLSLLQVGNPGELRMLAAVRCKDAAGVEAALHQLFHPHRGRGEWFKPSLELDRFIRVARGNASSQDIADSVMMLARDRPIRWALAAHGVSLERWQTVFEPA